MWRCVDPASTDVSEKRIASIFRVEKSGSGNQRHQVAAQRHIPEDDILQNVMCFLGFRFLNFIRIFRIQGKIVKNDSLFTCARDK
jgi:hypothetical protein